MAGGAGQVIGPVRMLERGRVRVIKVPLTSTNEAIRIYAVRM